MAVIEMLKKLTGRSRGGVADAERALAEISAEIANVEAVLADLEAEFGERLLEAMASGSAERVEEALEVKRRLLSRLRRAQGEVLARLEAARSAAQGAELQERWDTVEAALRARRLALVKLETAAKDFGKAILAAEAASREAWEVLPVRYIDNGRAARQSITPHFADLSGEVPRLLALATDGRAGGISGSALWALRQEPSLVERAEAMANQWRALRPGTATPPEAA